MLLYSKKFKFVELIITQRRAYCKAGSCKLFFMIPNELALVGADRIQDQPHTDAEAIDEHILFADVSHLFPKFLVLSEYPFPVIRQA